MPRMPCRHAKRPERQKSARRVGFNGAEWLKQMGDPAAQRIRRCWRRPRDTPRVRLMSGCGRWHQRQNTQLRCSVQFHRPFEPRAFEGLPEKNLQKELQELPWPDREDDEDGAAPAHVTRQHAVNALAQTWPASSLTSGAEQGAPSSAVTILSLSSPASSAGCA